MYLYALGLLMSFNDVNWKDPKLWCMIVAFGFGIASYVKYCIDMVKGETHPHPISWLVWLTTQIISTLTTYFGGGGYGAAYGFFYCFTISTILIYTLKVKAKWEEIHKADWICLAVCSAGVVIWLVFDTPIISLLMATGVDAYAYDPSFRKSYNEPWSESMWGWGLMIPNILLTIFALENYNWLTLPYHIVMLICTTSLVLICWRRRQIIPRPSD